MTDTYDINDAPPADNVIQVADYTGPGDPEDSDSPLWGRTTSGDWKGYKNGGKVYLQWAELVRRWGPVTVTMTRSAADSAVPKCLDCGRERQLTDVNDYNPLQAVTGAPLGWYSGDDGEFCPECLAKMLRGDR